MGKSLDAYKELLEFVDSHSEISIKKNEISLPSDSRDQFWELCDNLEISFLKEYFPTLYLTALDMSESFIEAEKIVSQNTGLMPHGRLTSVQKFLHDPTSCLTAGNNADEIFELLRGDVSWEQFEKNRHAQTQSTIRDLCKKAYPYWFAMAVLAELGATKLMQIPIPPYRNTDILSFAPRRIPPAVELSALEFPKAPDSFICTPDLVAVVGERYITFKFEYKSVHHSRRMAFNKPDRASTSTWKIAESRNPVIMMSVGKSYDDINVVSDRDTFFFPDFVIETFWDDGWLNEWSYKDIYFDNDSFRPARCSFVISKGHADAEEFDGYNAPKEDTAEEKKDTDPTEAVTEDSEALTEITDEEQMLPYEHCIRLVNAGFDRKALQPVIEELLTCEIR
jgi:hypothetical protein